MKEFKDFDEFNGEANFLLDKYSIILSDKIETEQVSFIRENIDKEILISYVFISNITNDVQILLNSKSKNLKLSLDNYLKNRIMHPEVTISDYLKIPNIVSNPSKVLKSKNGYDVILFKADEKYYKLVIKTTANKDENFVKSLHLLNYDRYIKY
jgi:hypothetical protein